MNSRRPGRSVHLIDIENLLSTPRPECWEVSDVRRRYASLVAIGPDDHVIVACNHGAALAVGFHWCSARLLVASGPDGADCALLDVLVREHLRERFDDIVLASGDGIFVDAVVALTGAGIRVTVVSRPQRLSRALGLAATDVVPFDGPQLPPPSVLAMIAA